MIAKSRRHSNRLRTNIGRIAVGFGRAVVAVAVAVVCAAADLVWTSIVFAVVVGVVVVTVSGLRNTTANYADAPGGVLDEYERSQRNTARSAGLAATQILMWVPMVYLGGASLVMLDLGADPQQLAFAGFLVEAIVLIGSSIPHMIIAWSRPDPDD